MTKSKAETLAEAMSLMSQGQVERFADVLLADDVVWHWPGHSSVSGDYHGREETVGLLRRFHELTGGQLSVEPLEILEGDEHLMSFTRVRASAGSSHLDVTMADAMRFGPDDRVVEYWTLSNDQAAVDAFIG